MSFENLLGNEDVKNYFNQSIIEKNFLHSYLFIGKEGIGKLQFAKEFAKYILCGDNKINCSCKSCISFDGNNHPDYKVINEFGDTIKIEEIRNFIEKVIEKPIVSERKVYIINDCEKMTEQAQNCLLKTLEEPPEFITIILISSNENFLLNTIKSRCTTIKFKNIQDDVLKKYIEDNLNYDIITENLLNYFEGSIGKAIKTQEKKEKLLRIENLIGNLKQKDFIDFMSDAKIIYDKDDILDILNYMIVCLYNEAKNENSFLNCIKYVEEGIAKLKSNAYLDMNIDIMLFKIWEEVNEKGNRS